MKRALIALGMLVAVVALWLALPGGLPLVVSGENCDIEVQATEDGKGLFVTQGCPANEDLWPALAAWGAGVLEGRSRFYLGQAPVTGWPFDICALYAQLAETPEWTDSTDSHDAARILSGLLPQVPLTQAAASALNRAGVALESVSMEMVLLDEGGSVCEMAPPVVPVSADLDLAFGN
ncbi:hypothetical protein [Vannielia litorea]|uniref:hypothetical protein n=1 Tax=Vannielia litorea TaxID=1217970 RepID=UPI001BCCCFF8|nr:hypothetical protein [Vannielia litorea]MBS8224883.1 hypothetical protein [Vannielia litorea]